MKTFFFDASALAKRYSLEAGSARVEDLFNKVTLDRLMCLMLGAAAALDAPAAQASAYRGLWRCLENARAALGGGAFAAATARGRRMSLDEAIAESVRVREW